MGIFSATLNYIHHLPYIRRHIGEIVSSDGFKEELRKNFAFSDDFLKSIDEAELTRRWKKITYFKYEKKFPVLWTKMGLKKHLQNYFFDEHNLDYYYRGLRIRYDICLEKDDELKIIQRTDFTVITNNDGKIELVFWVSNSEANPKEPTVDMDKTCIDNKSLRELMELDRGNFRTDNEEGRKKLTFTLKGNKEYQVEQVIDMRQDYNIDRVSSFDSSKIIDDIYVEINCCNKLDYFFEPVNNNKFIPDLMHDNGYKNKDIIMPGELFMIFIDKKDDQ